MFEGLFKAGRQFVGGIAKVSVGVAVMASAAVVGGAAIIYEGLSYGGNYTGELFNKARLAWLKKEDENVARKALITSAQKKGIIPAATQLTAYQDCLVDSASKEYAISMDRARTSTHVQHSTLFGKDIATFIKIINPPAQSSLANHFPISPDGIKEFKNCERFYDQASDDALSSIRMRNMTGSLTLKADFQSNADYQISPSFELSGSSLARDQYAELLAPLLIKRGISLGNLEAVIVDVEGFDRMRDHKQPYGQFYYSTQIRNLKASATFSRLDEPQKQALSTILNLSAKLPKHPSQIEEDRRIAEEAKQAQIRLARNKWENDEITRVANEEWVSDPKNSPEVRKATRMLMTPPPPEITQHLVGKAQAERDYANQMRGLEEKLQAVADHEYGLLRKRVEIRLRGEWAQQGAPQANLK